MLLPKTHHRPAPTGRVLTAGIATLVLAVVTACSSSARTTDQPADSAQASSVGTSSVAAVTPAPSADTRVATSLVTAFYRVFGTGDVASLDAVLTPHWVDDPLAAGQQPGRAGFAPIVGYFRSVFPDLTVTIQDIIVSTDGQYATVRTLYRGTQRAPFLGVNATGAKVSFRTTDVHRIVHGRIVQSWHLEDTYGALTQLTAAAKKSAGSN